MDYSSFCVIIETIRIKKPMLFEMSSLYHPTDDDFYTIQQLFSIILPDDYKDFYKKYCGGYFGFIALFTYDVQDEMYIMNFNSPEMVNEIGFFAVCDMETGDYIGYKVVDGKCNSELYYYDHESGCISDSNYTDFMDFVLREGLHYC